MLEEKVKIWVNFSIYSNYCCCCCIGFIGHRTPLPIQHKRKETIHFSVNMEILQIFTIFPIFQIDTNEFSCVTTTTTAAITITTKRSKSERKFEQFNRTNWWIHQKYLKHQQSTLWEHSKVTASWKYITFTLYS